MGMAADRGTPVAWYLTFGKCTGCGCWAIFRETLLLLGE